MPTLKFVLSVVLGYYLINLMVVLGKFAFRWYRAVWLKSVWFDMAVAGPESQGDNLYSSLNIVPWFYDEPKRHFTFTFGLRGFQFYFIPVEPITTILMTEFSALQSWQVLLDSAPIPVTRIDLFYSSRRSGFSPGDDLIFFTENEIDKEHVDRFAKEAWKDLVTHVCKIFSPPALIIKTGNRWSIGYKDPEIGRRIITRVFEEVGKKVLLKNGLQGNIRIADSDGADRFLARGQVSWWMKGRMEGDAVVIEGDGLRPGEVTSADWAIVTLPVEPS